MQELAFIFPEGHVEEAWDMEYQLGKGECDAAAGKAVPLLPCSHTLAAASTRLRACATSHAAAGWLLTATPTPPAPLDADDAASWCDANGFPA